MDRECCVFLRRLRVWCFDYNLHRLLLLEAHDDIKQMPIHQNIIGLS